MLDYNSMQKIEFWGVQVQAYQPQELQQQLTHWISGKPTWLVTINAEMLVRAKQDPNYKALLDQADVKIPDGYGLVLWSRGLVKYRFPGVDLTSKVLSLAEQQSVPVLCLVSTRGLSRASQVSAAIQHQWPSMQVTVVEVDPDQPFSVLETQAKIVLVNFGVPQQDEWLAGMKKHLPHMSLGVGVGGTFDYWTGAQTRAPRILRRLGLESLWRLIKQPQRIKRLWNALVVFSWYALWHTPRVAGGDKG